jgi:DNA polymerase IV
VVAAASYEARVFGIHSAMPISQAWRRCPQAAYLRPRMRLYADVSHRFMAILERYTDLVEPLSIDEAFLDVTESRALFGDGREIAARIKDEVRREERVTASIGVAPSKFLAKIASDLRKPDGLVVVPDAGVEAFLAELPVERLWGAGAKAVTRLHRLGARTFGDVARLGRERLVQSFGEGLGEHFDRLARGIDDRAVVSDRERKSVGRETTFAEDVPDRSVVERTLLELTDEVTRRLRRNGLAGQTVTVKLRTADFVTVTRRETLPLPADTTDVLWPTVKDLLARADLTAQSIRLIGVSLSSFDGVAQLPLFDSEVGKKSRRIARAMDAVTEKFGEDAIGRGSTAARRRASKSQIPNSKPE